MLRKRLTAGLADAGVKGATPEIVLARLRLVHARRSVCVESSEPTVLLVEVGSRYGSNEQNDNEARPSRDISNDALEVERGRPTLLGDDDEAPLPAAGELSEPCVVALLLLMAESGRRLAGD